MESSDEWPCIELGRSVQGDSGCTAKHGLI